MEQQNINLINKHKPELLKQIKVNQVLLGHFSSDVLGVSDIEEVDSKTMNTEKVATLLNILVTRIRGFEMLIKALQDTNQDGALKLLDSSMTETATGMINSSAGASAGTSNSLSTGSTRSAKDLLVGSSNCKIGKVVNVVNKSPVSQAFYKDLPDFARELDVDSTKRNEILGSNDKPSDKFENIITQWKGSNSEEATLKVLLDAIDEFNYKEITDALKKAFSVT